MKKILIVFVTLILLTGCGKKIIIPTGEETDLSKKYLSKGYIVNVYRNVIPLSDSIEDMGKGNVQIIYNIRADYYLNIDFDVENEYLEKQTVSNINVIKSPKKGMINTVYGNYGSYFYDDFKMTGSTNTYTHEFPLPSNVAEQTSIAFVLDNVAYIDSLKYPDGITTKELYNALGIDNDAVTMQVSFRVDLYTVGGKRLYKDFVIDLPPTSYDITGNEFRTDFVTEDINTMEAFKEI